MNQDSNLSGRMKAQGTLRAALFLAIVLAVAFWPAVFGNRSLLIAGWDAASVMNTGAYDGVPRPPLRLMRTSDPGASAWQSEAWYKLISDEFWTRHSLPLWNPYNAYGTPLSADAISQPFFPLTVLFSLHVTPWTYNVFIISRLFLGGMLMFLFARQFLTALPALVAATTFMLSGYFIIYLNIAHLSVEVLTPGIFLVFELLLRRNSWTAVAGVATMILLGMAGGMPESLFLVMAFGALYFAARLLFTPRFRRHAVTLSVKFVASVVLGFALSGFLLLPFIEFVGQSHNVHDPANIGGIQGGLLHDGDYYTAIQYLLPLIFGPILSSIFSNFAGWSGLRGYWGIIPFFLSAVALFAVFCGKRPVASNSERFLAIFFTATLVLMVLKRFGNSLINWIGQLPLFEMVLFTKYQEPLMALCIAMLAGVGFAILAERRTATKPLIAATVATLGMLSLAAVYLPAVRSVIKESMYQSISTKISIFYYLSIGCGVALLLAVTALLLFAQRASETVRSRLLGGVAAILCLELLFNFLVPSFYLFTTLAPRSADPYKGAPYIDFIRAQNADHSRIFARESFLYPNWSSAFGLSDIRSLDAMHYKRYREFLRSFLLPPGDTRQHGDLADRFTGDDLPFEFATETEKRFLALSSVKYLIGDSEYLAPSKVLGEIVEQHRGENIWGFGADTFRTWDKWVRTMPGLSQHPPSHRISYKTVIDPNEPVLKGIAAIKIEAATRTDGAGFRLEIRNGNAIDTLFETNLDPRNIPADLAGHPFRIDLSQYAGREVELLFSTDPGPRGDANGDWAGWAGLRFVAKDGAGPPPPFKTLYDGEVRVFEVPDVMPRAALFPAVEVLPDDEVLARLKDPAFNPRERAIVSQESVPAEEVGKSRLLAEAGAASISPARISRYESQHVQIEADTAVPALLVLNDANYPGWRAYVNGQPAAWVKANYLFRGVFLAPGKSTVEFKYQPRSFQIGAGLSAAALAILGGLVFRERRRRKAVDGRNGANVR
jgi:Bacterial membrane protein YfhO